MFEKSFEGRVEKVVPRRVKDEDGGAIHLSMHMCMPMGDDHLDELGAEIRALVDSRHSSEGARSIPFKKATLDIVYKDLTLVVYGPALEDGKANVRFQVDGCEVKGMELVRNKSDVTTASLKWKTIIPPLKQREMAYLIEAVDQDLQIALVESQMALEV